MECVIERIRVERTILPLHTGDPSNGDLNREKTTYILTAFRSGTILVIQSSENTSQSAVKFVPEPFESLRSESTAAANKKRLSGCGKV